MKGHRIKEQRFLSSLDAALGFLFSFQGMPLWVRAVGKDSRSLIFWVPLGTYSSRGDSAELVVSEIKPVAIFVVIVSICAVAAYRRRID